jgi:hypothetical protein
MTQEPIYTRTPEEYEEGRKRLVARCNEMEQIYLRECRRSKMLDDDASAARQNRDYAVRFYDERGILLRRARAVLAQLVSEHSGPAGSQAADLLAVIDEELRPRECMKCR